MLISDLYRYLDLELACVQASFQIAPNITCLGCLSCYRADVISVPVGLDVFRVSFCTSIAFCSIMLSMLGF